MSNHESLLFGDLKSWRLQKVQELLKLNNLLVVEIRDIEYSG